MLRVIKEARPTWVVAENVANLVRFQEFETCCTDLEALGYEVQPLIIPACAVGAPHRRDRVWIIAYSQSEGERAVSNGGEAQNTNTYRQISTSPNSDRDKLREQSESRSKVCTPVFAAARKSLANSDGKRLQRKKTEGNRNRYITWDSDRSWDEIAARLCRMDDGHAVRVDKVTLTKAAHRNARIKACGNAIVWQVAERIFQAIKEAEESFTRPN